MWASTGGLWRAAALVLGLGAIGCVGLSRGRWARLALVLASLCLLAAPWWGAGRPGHVAPTWHDVLAEIALFAALWRVSRGEARRPQMFGLAAALVVVSVMGLVLETTGGACPELLSLAAWWLLPAAAGIVVGATFDVSVDWEAAGGTALALQGGALLALLVARQEACGAIWGWDPLVCLWLTGLATIVVARLIGTGRGDVWKRGMLVSAAAVWAVQASLCGPIAAWLGYVAGCVVW